MNAIKLIFLSALLAAAGWPAALLMPVEKGGCKICPRQMFTKILGDVTVNDGGSSYGCAWGDYDNDGFIDLVVGNGWGHLNFLYHNNGDGTFTRVTNGPVATDIGDTGGVIWGDYDNDGWPDLFAVNYAPYRDALYRNNGDGTFTKVAAGPHVNDNGNGLTAAWADYDRDGWLDLFVANSLSENDFLYHGNGDATFTKIISGPVVSSGGTSIGAAWGDYDNDGDPDLVVANSHTVSSGVAQDDFLFRNDGNGIFTRITSGPVVSDGARSSSAAWADYDNDGNLDLFVATGFAQNDRLYQNLGGGNFALVTNVVSTDGLSANGSAWGDFDNDGWIDLFVANWQGHRNRLYRNRGDGSFEVVTNGVIPTEGGISLACAWGDYNNDGFLDLFVANGGPDPDVYTENNNYLYRNDGNTNRWLLLRLLGRASNRSAIGAKVRLKASIGGRVFWQMREISGGSGYCSQNDLRAHFGLGNATNADVVRIEWPSGTVQEFSNVSANQILTVKEPPVLTALGRLGAKSGFVMALKGGQGISYTVESSTNLIHWEHLTSFVATSNLHLFGDAPFQTLAAPSGTPVSTMQTSKRFGVDPITFYRAREDD